MRSILLLAAALGAALAGSVQAQLTLRGDYAASRGITELSALYAKQTKTTVQVNPFSTNAGIEGVLNGSIDVAASARPPLPNRPAEQELVFWPVAWDAVVFIVHPSNPVAELSLAQIRDIYLGKLDNWNQVGGKDAPIDLYSVMGPYDGLESVIRQMLFGNPNYMAKIDRLFLNQHQIEVGIQMDPDAIGMTTLAGLDKQKVRQLRVEGTAADKDTVRDGRYLLTLPLYMVYRNDNPKAAEITRFAEFLRTPAAESVIVNKRLVPHREDEDFKAMHAQRLATVWEKLGGAPVPAGAVRFANSQGDAQADGTPPAATATTASAGTANASSPVPSATATATRTTASTAEAPARSDATAQSVPAAQTAATAAATHTVAEASSNGQRAAAGGGAADAGEDKDCKKTDSPSRKC